MVEPRVKRAKVLQENSLDRLNRPNFKKTDTNAISTTRIHPSPPMINNINHYTQQQLSQLNNEITSLRTQTAKLDFEIYKKQCALKDLRSQVFTIDDQIEQLDHHQQTLLNEIQFKHDLSIEQYNATHNAQVCRLKQSLIDEIECIINDTVTKCNQEKSQLQSIVDDLTHQLKCLEQELNRKLIKLKEDHNKKLISSIQSLDGQIESETAMVESTTNEIAVSHQSLNRAKLELQNVCIENEKLESQLATIRLNNDTKQKEIIQLQESLALKQQYITDTKQSFITKKHKIQELEESTSQINQQLTNLESTRRWLHNQLQELKGNIRVFCRIRPVFDEGPVYSTEVPESALNDEGSQELNLACMDKSYKFHFDKIFPTMATNGVIFQEIWQLIQSSMDGYNVCVFAYGQTGSGKTYTMSHHQDGIIPLSIEKIFSDITELEAKGWSYSIEGQFIEIYNETIVDLLLPRDVAKHEIKHNETTNETMITNVTSVAIESKQQANSILERANKNRSTASTKSNERSSRSHSIFILKINGENSKTGESCRGTLNLIDLAGSERLSASQAKGDRLKETQAINKSLSALGDVIYSLGERQNSPSSTPHRHIPYRNSKLTYLLKNSLGGNSKTLMFVNISPLEKNFNESVNSLRFASKVNSTKLKRSLAS
jgi:kinesin family protein C1